MPQSLKIKLSSEYDLLLREVKQTLLEGQRIIEDQRVKTYWETGKLISDHILKNADRAEYGAQVINKLAEDLKVDDSLLDRCVKFAKTYPQMPISAGRQKFKWSHFRELIKITDESERSLLEKEIRSNGLTAQELENRIVQKKSESSPVASAIPDKKAKLSALLTPLRGTLYTYRVVDFNTVSKVTESQTRRVDLGFSMFYHATARQLKSFENGAIVRSLVQEEEYGLTSQGSAKDLYTYEATVEKVVDGDTLHVLVDVGFSMESRQKLRLRGLDCPEVDTKEGQEAKTLVQSLVKGAPDGKIIIRSSRSDKYDRYLADVFIPQPNAQDIYLNNLLLETGRARRMVE